MSILHDGSIVVCDCLNNRVQLFTSEGVFLSAFGSEGRSEGEFWRPMGVAVDSENRIVVVDQGKPTFARKTLQRGVYCGQNDFT